jgi:putative acetyltransferase
MEGRGPLEICKVRRPRDWRRLRTLLEAYAAELGVDLSFQGFALELEDVAAAYPSPGGAWLALRGGTAVGCVALRTTGRGFAELKRLFALPEERHTGVGRALVKTALAAARALGVEGVRLDTLPGMDAAQALYHSLGFRPIAPYRDNPVPGATFLELTIPLEGVQGRRGGRLSRG